MAWSDDDQALLARIAQRDEASIGVLYERYSALVFSLLLRIVGDREVAEELLQETFFHAWRGASTYDASRGPVASWLVTIARNRGIDELRRGRRQPRPVPHGGQTESEFLRWPDPVADVAGQGWADMRRAEVTAALRQLPTSQRIALELAYFEGLSQSEIAARLQEPLGTVKTRVRLGLRKLRQLLDGRSLTDYMD